MHSFLKKILVDMLIELNQNATNEHDMHVLLKVLSKLIFDYFLKDE